MKKRKKITTVLLIIFGIMTSVPVQAQEIADVQESIDVVGKDCLTSEDGQWQYEILETDEGEKYIDLYEYNGNEEVLAVPSKINGITVCSMGSIVFYNNETLREVTLPKTIVTVSQGVFKTAYALEKISIENPTEAGFHTIDGVFFNGKQLVAYPPAKQGDLYVIPEGTTDILNGAFFGCADLKKIVVPSSAVYYRTCAFAKCKQPIDIILKGTSSTALNFIKNACWEMPVGTRYLTKTEEYKAKLLEKMTSTSVYKDSTDTMAVEVMNPTPATALTFSDGTTEAWVQASYTDTGYTGDPVNNFYLQSLYQQEPYDTTDNVTWSLVSADTCPAILNEKNPDKYVCQVTSGGTIITYAGGNAVLKGTDESGHELILHVAVYSPMETFEVKGRSGPSVKAGEEAVVYADITPEYSYANNVKVTWTSSNPEVATVEAYGTVTAKINGLEAGYTTLTATVNDNGKLISKTLEVSVFDYITNCTVDPIPAQTYLGEQLKPVPVVCYHERILTEGIDYEVVYYGDNCAIGKQEGYMCINGLNTTFARTVKTLNAYFDIIDGRSNPSGVNPTPGTGENQNPSNNTGSSHTPSTGDPNTASNDPEQGNGTDTAIKTFQAKNIKYTVTSAKEVKVTGPTKKSIRSVTIPATVKYKGTTYKVTSIGSKAFYNCKKLKTVTIKSRKLKSVGKNAFKGIYKKAKVTVPKSKYKAYRKLFKKAGFSSKTVWKKK
ncbi:leucine-rich repeat protein [Roseburia sp. BX1005]|uniref:Leucine-rich repeat protein n=1 Tax=Roseburia zhanii TaxID=2763064 RepID=A0A923RTA8_9FIRM|nr:leucine-rich repeat protein [Roseburia zhanii]MBC5714473.1 leucine-rich repeat protein [Roseburia zhanii]